MVSLQIQGLQFFWQFYQKFDKIYLLNKISFCIVVTIIKDKISNSSRGFGFITFESPDDADDAVKGMDRTVSEKNNFTLIFH